MGSRSPIKSTGIFNCNMTEYEKLLKDPRWKAKRIEILKRDNYRCRKCLEKTKVLHVHHTKYKGNPWEISNVHLMTLCPGCHRKEHNKPPKKAKTKSSFVIKFSKEARHYIELAKKANDDYLKIFAILIVKCSNGKRFKFSINCKILGEHIRSNPHGITTCKNFLIEDNAIELKDGWFYLSDLFMQNTKGQSLVDLNNNIIDYIHNRI